jgi:hypothetical protein
MTDEVCNGQQRFSAVCLSIAQHHGKLRLYFAKSFGLRLRPRCDSGTQPTGLGFYSSPPKSLD